MASGSSDSSKIGKQPSRLPRARRPEVDSRNSGISANCPRANQGSAYLGTDFETTTKLKIRTWGDLPGGCKCIVVV